MTDNTPTTEEIKEAWNRRYDGEHTSAPRAEREKYDAEFDRWLANHDRLVAAATLRKAASDPEIQDNRPWVEWWLLNRINALEES